MSAVVADTHALLWYLNNSPLLSAPARTAFENAEQTGQPIYVPSIVIVEMRYLVEKRTITEANYKTVLAELRDPATAPTVIPLDTETADALEQIVRADVPDMPDRIIAATAHYLGLPLVTRDSKITASGIHAIW
jgi:PIN domain nuclease of toxin-antitoxin system